MWITLRMLLNWQIVSVKQLPCCSQFIILIRELLVGFGQSFRCIPKTCTIRLTILLFQESQHITIKMTHKPQLHHILQASTDNHLKGNRPFYAELWRTNRVSVRDVTFAGRRTPRPWPVGVSLPTYIAHAINHIYYGKPNVLTHKIVFAAVKYANATWTLPGSVRFRLRAV